MKIDFDQLVTFLARIWFFQVLHIDGKPITIGSLFVGIGVILFGLYAARRLSIQISKIMENKFSVHRTSLGAIQTFSFYLLVILFSFFGLSVANIPLTVFTVAGGALAIGVGFGSQNVMNNFISGLILLMEQPIRVNDYVELDGTFGKVQRIGFRSTTLLALGNRQLIVPNSSFIEKNVLNWTLSDRIVRAQVAVGVAYGSPARKVEALLLESVRQTKLVLAEPEPFVLFKDFGDNSLNFEVTFSVEIKEIRDRELAASSVRFLIEEKFREAGISIPFPQRDLHLKMDTPLEIRLCPVKAEVVSRGPAQRGELS
ncbi:MAG: mechanosensitive ion channel [Cryobacterium sp.]|nr:mechanosensitive ion channel [Oligoflexia bacterium]